MTKLSSVLEITMAKRRRRETSETITSRRKIDNSNKYLFNTSFLGNIFLNYE